MDGRAPGSENLVKHLSHSDANIAEFIMIDFGVLTFICFPKLR